MNSEQEKARLLQLYERSLRAHFENDARTFLAGNASQWYDVRNAGVRLRTKEEAFPTIEQYFKRTHFYDISEITPPIIHLSTDASMAWMIGDIRVCALLKRYLMGKSRTFRFVAPGCPSMKNTRANGHRWSMLPPSSSRPMTRKAAGE